MLGNPITPMFEGVPEVGLHMLGWDDFSEDTPEILDEEKRAYSLGVDILHIKSIIQIEACYKYHVLHKDKEYVTKWMQQSGIFSEQEAKNVVTFFTDPVQKYYYPAYYYGKILLQQAYDVIPKTQRKEFFEILYNMPHTTKTLCNAVSKISNIEFKL
ncbi:MAG: hypothetical protein BEN19_08775 [Epulopiscium sp. Nuni2H_MBin003]|nr:MAG: hypothetical protein BEN19_08775 [Epulopiscium sp. Nuni2H_MBin003]